MEETKKRNFKNVIKGAGIILIICFFTLPLVQCTQDRSLTASGWEIATGTGDLYTDDADGDPLAFLLVVFPAVLLILAFKNKPFSTLRNVSVGGAAFKIIFIGVAHSRINSGDAQGLFELTAFNWIVLAIYIGLCIFTQYCKKLEG